MARILVIDDDAEVRRTLVRMLESAGHEVHQAADGETGITVCNQILPHLVITDR
ncbi:MAG: response regulator [Alphaproteobacteria bacterium]|nr:response regulator [Alphaproteobacteria bacterium]